MQKKKIHQSADTAVPDHEKILLDLVTLILAALSRICLMVDLGVTEGCIKLVNLLMSGMKGNVPVH